MTTKDVPKCHRELYKKALAGKSRVLAVKCFCYQCMGWDRAEAHKCDTKSCPLWKFSPAANKLKRIPQNRDKDA